MAKPATPVLVTADDPEIVAEADRAGVDPAIIARSRRYAAAKVEAKQHAEWVRGGSNGPEPATPNVNALKENTPMSTRVRTAKKSSSAARAPKPADGFQILKNGKALSRNNLSFAAWCATKGIDTKSPDRIGVEALRVLLAKAGVTDPEGTSWSVELPNGVTLAGVQPGTAAPVAKKAAAAKSTRPTAKASAATKAPAKSTPTKAAAKKSPAKATTARKASTKGLADLLPKTGKAS